MKTIYRIFSLLLIFTMVVVVTQAQNRKAGLNAATFLNVGVGARDVGLGSAVTSISNDVNQVFWNPAGSALKYETVQAAVNYNKWIGDLNHNCVAVGYNLQDVGTISLGIITFGASDIPANRDYYTDATLQANSMETNSASTYDYMDMAISLTYAKYVIDNLSLGVTAKYIHENIDDVTASSVAFDFGSIYDISKRWKISARLTNLGSDIKFYDRSAPIPLWFSIGTSYEFSSYSDDMKTEDIKALILVDAVKPQDGQQYFFGGAELKLLDNAFAVRGGYKFFYSGTQDEATTYRSAYNTTVENYSLGASIKVPVEDYDIYFDYAYTSMDLFGGAHRVTLRFGLK
jgi:hypothetical protein